MTDWLNYDEEHPCPACGETIAVIAALDDGECPECETPRDELFKIARASTADTDSEDVDAATGGEADV
jgi:rubredoxin